MEEYLTVEELCRKTKYSRQSIYNMINKNIFKLNQHYGAGPQILDNVLSYRSDQKERR